MTPITKFSQLVPGSKVYITYDWRQLTSDLTAWRPTSRNPVITTYIGSPSRKKLSFEDFCELQISYSNHIIQAEYPFRLYVGDAEAEKDLASFILNMDSRKRLLERREKRMKLESSLFKAIKDQPDSLLEKTIRFVQLEITKSEWDR